MEVEPEDAEKGYSVYSGRTLALYDWWILGLSNSYIWKCPTEILLAHYRAHLSANHLDVGAGTGYFLEKAVAEGTHPRIALLDANRDCLNHAARRLESLRPEIHQENILDAFDLQTETFDSIAINYLLHCLPGDPEWKTATALDHLLPLLGEDGVLFGATILGKDIQRPLAARFLMSYYNRRGIFSNREDSLGVLMKALTARFKTFKVEVHGCVVLFSGRGLRDSYREQCMFKESL